MNLPRKAEKMADVTVEVDVSKIVRNLSIAGVLVVGIVVGLGTYRRIRQNQRAKI